MQPLTTEWLAKAEEDLAVAGREAARDESPAFNAVCFHAQQAAEKFIKAVLQERGVPVPHMHNLAMPTRLTGCHFGRSSSSKLLRKGRSGRYPPYGKTRVTADGSRPRSAPDERVSF